MTQYSYVWSGNLLITDYALCKFYGIRKWEDIPTMEKELKGIRYKEVSMMCGESQEVRDMMGSKIQDLKKIALRNYTNPTKMIGNKSYKKTWVKEVLKGKKRGFNTFVVGVQSASEKHPLRGQVDVLLMIQNFV